MLTTDIIHAVLTAIDSKLAATDPLTIEDLELVQKLMQAKVALEAMSLQR